MSIEYNPRKFSEQITETYLRGSESSLIITGSVGIGLGWTLTEYLNEFKGTKMIITHKMLFRMYELDLNEDAVIIKNPEKLIMEDISIYTPDLLFVDWYNRNPKLNKYTEVIKKIASQAKRVIIKKAVVDPTIDIENFNEHLLDKKFNLRYAVKEF